MRRLWTIAVISLWIGSIASGSAWTDEPRFEPEPLRAIKAAQAQWLSTISTLRVRIHREHDPECEMVRDSGFAGSLFSGDEDWIWTDRGQYRVEQWSFQDGRLHARELKGGDGKTAFLASFSKADLRGPPISLTVGPQVIRKMGDNHYFLTGLWHPDERKWLANLLEEGRVEYQATEAVDGRRLELVHLPVIPPGESEPRSGGGLLLWLDPEHQFLPRLIGDRSGGESRVSLVVEEFREVVPGWWFPAKGRLDFGGLRDAIRVDDIQLNARLEESLFKPPLAPGVLVRDSMQGKEYVVGGEAGKKLYQDREAARFAEFKRTHPAPALPGAAISTVAHPRPTILANLKWVFFGLAIAAFAVALLVHWRR